MKFTKALLAFALLGFLGNIEAKAQPHPQAPVTSALEASKIQSTYTEDDWKAFSRAVISVDQVGQLYLAKLNMTKDPAEGSQIKEEAKNEVLKAIEKEGLQAEQYQQMHQLIRQDPKLLEKVKSYLPPVTTN
jgi:hypothetical protein